ncbi:hypothetical protein [Thalassotalea sp. ND16A]|nr:hypothetical protein [Thalassotalea sp. ND16A]
MNEAGETVDSRGNQVLVLDSKNLDGTTEVIEKDNIVYILN